MVGISRLVAHGARETPQDVGGPVVAEMPCDAVQPVDRGQHEAQRPAVTPGAQHLGGQRLVERALVAQARDAVDERHHAHLLFAVVKVAFRVGEFPASGGQFVRQPHRGPAQVLDVVRGALGDQEETRLAAPDGAVQDLLTVAPAHERERAPAHRH